MNGAFEMSRVRRAGLLGAVAATWIAGAALGAAILAPGDAAAATISFSYSGTVSSGLDPSGLFGGGNLAGAAITVSGFYDPTAYATQQLNQSNFYDIFFHDTPGASQVNVTMTTVANGQFTRSLTSGGSFIANDFLDTTAGGTFDYGVYGPMAGFGSSQAVLDPQLHTTGGTWVSGSTIYGPPGVVTFLALQASRDASDGSLTDNITVTNLTDNNAAAVPEPGGMAGFMLAAAMAAVCGRRRRG